MKQKILTISAIFTVLALVLVIFLIYPLFEEIKENSEKLILEKRKLISFKAENENLEEFREAYLLLEPDIEKIDKLLIDPEVPIDFIKFLEKTGSDSKVPIKISPISSKASKLDSWPSLGFQIALTSSFSDFLKFLRKIESSPYLIEIYNLNLRGLSENEIETKKFEGFSTGDINATLLMKVYTK